MGRDELEAQLEQLEAAARLNPENADARYELGLVLYQTGRLRRAIEEYRHAIRLSPAEVAYYLALANVFQTANMRDEAGTLLFETTEAFPGSIEARIELGNVRFESGRFEEALLEFQRAGQLAEGTDFDTDEGRENRALIHLRIGYMHLNLIQFDDALKAFRNALALRPDNVEVHLALGKLYLRRSRLEEALGAYHTVLAQDPRNPSAHEGIAEASLRLGRFSESIAAAEMAIEIDPERLGSHYQRATALIRSGREEEALAALEGYRILEAQLRARDHRNREVGGVYKAALAQMLDGNGSEAVRLLREGIETHPDSGELYLNLGVTLNSLERYTEAIGIFETMIDRGMGDDPLVRRSLDEAYRSLGASNRNP